MRLRIPRPNFDIAGLLEVAGILTACYGIWLVYEPAAFIVGGSVAAFIAQGMSNDTAG